MKKKKIKTGTNESIPGDDEKFPEDQLPEKPADAIPINEFIKIKKLQNQVLEKMLEKISHPDPQEKNSKRKTNQ
jgi:hypothetical protein